MLDRFEAANPEVCALLHREIDRTIQSVAGNSLNTRVGNYPDHRHGTRSSFGGGGR